MTGVNYSDKLRIQNYKLSRRVIDNQKSILFSSMERDLSKGKFNILLTNL